ncbi:MULTISPECIES: chromate transporter [Bacillaceae]|uniref:chromate transporter n=1 Tax=Bacillaceae TaxID=186817 RepID=UPI0010491D63|nr:MULTISPECIES: chromate transporter [Bacillaceae]TDB49944.1 chromate transporter [Bacillus sp. CBEL-1]
MQQLHIFIAFFRSGMLGYGGGPSAIPLVKKEVVDTYKWMDSDEFGDVLAIANTLPGPIATKLAGYIGYQVGGVLGMINALIAAVAPTVLLMVLLLTTLTQFKDEAWVMGMTKAVVPVVGVMLAVMTWDFLKKSTGGLGWTKAILLAFVSLILMEFIHVHPAIIIILLMVAAWIPVKRKQEEKEVQEQKRETV